jgi:hypothetical protein
MQFLIVLRRIRTLLEPNIPFTPPPFETAGHPWMRLEKERPAQFIGILLHGHWVSNLAKGQPKVAERIYYA